MIFNKNIAKFKCKSESSQACFTNLALLIKNDREIIRALQPKFCWHGIKNLLSLKNGTAAVT